MSIPDLIALPLVTTLAIALGIWIGMSYERARYLPLFPPRRSRKPRPRA